MPIRRLLKHAIVAFCVAALLFIVLAIVFAPSIVRVLESDPALVRPRSVAVLNPARDKTPERLADEYLRKLAAGDSESLQSTFGANRSVMLKEERRFPPVAWRIAARQDAANGAVLRYWIRRRWSVGEEEGIFEFAKKPTWLLVSYNAVY